MHRYNRYSRLDLVPKNEYEYLKEDCENKKKTVLATQLLTSTRTIRV